MKIQARIDRVVNSSTIKAIASVSMDSWFVIKNLRVVDGKKGMFVAYPQESYTKGGETKYSNIFFPISNAGKVELENAVLSAYQQYMNPQQERKQDEAPAPTYEPSYEPSYGQGCEMPEVPYSTPWDEGYDDGLPMDINM